MPAKTKTTRQVKRGIKVKASIKAGKLGINHNRQEAKPGVKVKASIKAGKLGLNHNRRAY